MFSWRPIATAPKDGQHILVWAGTEPVIARYWVGSEPTTHSHAYPWQAVGRAESLRADIPTHWQPLPEPPAA